MNTYVLLAPDYVQVEDWNSDCRYFHTQDLAHARKTAGEIWRCDSEDIVCLVAFRGMCHGISTKLPSNRTYTP